MTQPATKARPRCRCCGTPATKSNPLVNRTCSDACAVSLILSGK